MRAAIVLTVLSISTSAFASEGYWQTPKGGVWLNSKKECWHTSKWTPGKTIPGCDGMPLTPPPPPASPPPAVAGPLDTDDDGVTDDNDKCPNTPAGAKVDSDGCPPDSDHDGVSDELDKCPNTPAGALVDAVGCPKKLEREVSINLDVNFVTARADIEGDATSEIRKVGEFMKNYPAVAVTIEGYTDDRGSAAMNKKLSQKRAEAVKAALVADGVDAARLTAVGFGSDKPVADNATEEGRAKNRRVVAHAQAETTTIEMKKK